MGITQDITSILPMERIGRLLRSVTAFRCEPRRDTYVAAATSILMFAAFYVGNHSPLPVAFLVLVVLGNGILNVVFPAYYMLRVEKANPEELGLTNKYWWQSLSVSAVVTICFWHQLQDKLVDHREFDVLPAILFGGVILWEPFFVYGWLLLRYDRAFGTVPGIVLSALCMAGFHFGTVETGRLDDLVIVGIVYGILFRTTRNLLIIWPLPYSVGAAIGLLDYQGEAFGWRAVGVYAVLLAIQMAVLGWLVLYRRPHVE